jgi:hypothetical protein
VDALAGALADMFWRCGERKSAIVALPADEVHIKECSTYVKDSVTEYVRIELSFKGKKRKFSIHNRKYSR